MNLSTAFQEFITKENLFAKNDLLLLAVSGGLDSVVLTDLCFRAGYAFSIAHCHFGLRGVESDRDERFVQNLAKRYACKLLIKHFDTKAYASQQKVSIQVAARELRYAWFAEIMAAQQPAADGNSSISTQDSSVQPVANQIPSQPVRLLTAHHLDDNIETLLMNFFKGTGITGLRGIQPRQNKIVRPLLFAKKEWLQQYAREHQLTWVEDSSNQSTKYSRNYFRHQVIPAIRNVFPAVETNLGDNLTRFREIEILYRQAIALHKKKLVEKRGEEIHIAVLKLQKAEPLNTVIYEIARDYGFGPLQVPDIVALLTSDTGKYTQSATHRIIRNRNWLMIAPRQSGGSAPVVVEGDDRQVLFEGGELLLQQLTKTPADVMNNADPRKVWLDARQIGFPLLLRKWKTGDYFYPLGMHKKKKLARFFIDQKLSTTAKEKVWVLESAQRIIWVVGMRPDDRFKITAGTQQVLQITLK